MQGSCVCGAIKVDVDGDVMPGICRRLHRTTPLRSTPLHSRRTYLRRFCMSTSTVQRAQYEYRWQPSVARYLHHLNLLEPLFTYRGAQLINAYEYVDCDDCRKTSGTT
jgi:hypothetical protein